MYRIRKPDDYHIHLRQGEDLPLYLEHAARQFSRFLIMPNIVPPVNSVATLEEYRHEIERAASVADISPTFTPLFTCKLSPVISPEEFSAMVDAGITAAKYYPLGATTNAEDGVSSPDLIYPLLSIMEERDIVLCIHGEDPTAYVLERESAFLPVLTEIRRKFPDLRIVLEHISTAEGIEAVKSLGGRTAGTITVHHLMKNLNDLLGGFLDPHLFCKPVLKHPSDQQALMAAVFEGDSRFFLGTDSAPHHRDAKECACGCAGTYTAPVAIPALFEFFVNQLGESVDTAERFERFTSEYGARFYGLELSSETITLTKEPWTVPGQYGPVVPYLAGKSLNWSIV